MPNLYEFRVLSRVGGIQMLVYDGWNFILLFIMDEILDKVTEGVDEGFKLMGEGRINGGFEIIKGDIFFEGIVVEDCISKNIFHKWI